MTFPSFAVLPRALAAVCLAWAGASAPTTAQELPPVLPPSEAVMQVLAQLPPVRAAGAGIPLAQARSQRLQAGPHDWVAKAAANRRSDTQGGRFSETEIGLETGVRWPAKVAADQRLGAAEISVGEGVHADAWHEAARSPLNDWFDALRDTRSATLLAEQTQLASRQLATTQRRVQAGEAAQLELLAAQAEEARIQALSARAQAQSNLRRQALQRQYPGLPDAADSLSAFATLWPGQDAPNLPVAHWAEQILADNHELELAQMRAEQAQLQAQRAQLEQRGDPTLGVRATRERSGQEKVWGIYVSIPLGGAGRRADFEAALAQAEVARHELEQVRQRVETQAWRTASEAEQARATRAQMHRALAKIQQSAALQARAYELGESPLADLLLARRNALEAQLAADTASLDAMQAHARLLLDSHRLWSAPGAAVH